MKVKSCGEKLQRTEMILLFRLFLQTDLPHCCLQATRLVETHASRITVMKGGKKSRWQTSHFIRNKENNNVCVRRDVFRKGLSTTARKRHVVGFLVMSFGLIFPPSSLIPLGTVAVEIPSFYKNRAVLRAELCSLIPCRMHVRNARTLAHPHSTCWMSLTVARWY